MALPLTTLDYLGRAYLLNQLRDLIGQYKADRVVLGYPKKLDGSVGPAAERATEHAEWLKSELEQEVILWDERLSTAEVERVLQAAGVGHKRRKQVRDQLAAQRILQNYLDYSRNRSGDSR